MGAWGTGSFENDDAHDWLNDFFDAPSMEAVEEALTTVAAFDADEYLEMPECGAALAAAEIVAALRGAPSSDLPADVTLWVREQRERDTSADARLVGLARRAVGRVKADSEMNDTWINEATRQQWLTRVADLEARLDRAAV